MLSEFHNQGLQMFQWQHVQEAEQHQCDINHMEMQWVGGVLQVGTLQNCN